MIEWTLLTNSRCIRLESVDGMKHGQTDTGVMVVDAIIGGGPNA